MNTIRIAILNADQSHLNQTATYLSSRRGILVVGTATGGRLGLRLIRHEQPDLVLISLFLRGMDGLSVLREIQHLASPPIVIVYTPYCTSATLELSFRLGASYFLCCPTEMPCLYNTIVDQFRIARRARAAAAAEIPGHPTSAQILQELCAKGISRHLGGSRYLAEAIHLVAETPASLCNLTRNVYAEIADHYHTSIACVERNIRTAIFSAFSHGMLSSKYSVCPTNREFIRSVAGQISAAPSKDDT